MTAETPFAAQLLPKILVESGEGTSRQLVGTRGGTNTKRGSNLTGMMLHRALISSSLSPVFASISSAANERFSAV
jgi:hypothetical protein